MNSDMQRRALAARDARMALLDLQRVDALGGARSRAFGSQFEKNGQRYFFKATLGPGTAGLCRF
jgi:hypothetical protein